MQEQPGGYKWRARALSIASWVLGISFGLCPVAIAKHFNPDLSPAILLVLYAASVPLLVFAWRLYFKRPEELDKKIPIISKERKRRKKEFYDWLDSQGRSRDL